MNKHYTTARFTVNEASNILEHGMSDEKLTRLYRKDY